MVLKDQGSRGFVVVVVLSWSSFLQSVFHTAAIHLWRFKKIFLKIFIYLLSACYVPGIVGAVRTQILALMACIPNTFQGTFVGCRYESGTAGT